MDISKPSGSRQYKSRKNRPCDLCRSRKAACYIRTQPPCELCRAKGHQCTFLKGPNPRRRPDAIAGNQMTTHSHAVQSRRRSESVQEIVRPWSANRDVCLPGTGMDIGGSQADENNELAQAIDMLFMDNLGNFTSLTQQSPPNRATAEWGRLPNDAAFFDLASGDAPDPRQPMAEDHDGDCNGGEHDADESHQPTSTLDGQRGRSYRFVGSSGELDTYLISRRQHNQLLQSESPFTSLTYQYTSSPTVGALDFRPPSVFTVGDTSRLSHSEPQPIHGSLDQLRARFNELVPCQLSRELFRVFMSFINGSFPVLIPEQIPKDDDEVYRMPLSLLSAVCATSLPFIIYDDTLCIHEPESSSSSTELFRIARAALHLEAFNIRLSTVQASLLLLQRQAHEDLFGEATFNWWLCGSMVASCQTLGLNRDPTLWVALEPWERRLRKRLWWAVFVTETWTAFGQGMPGHFDLDECDVPLPERADFTDQSSSCDNGTGGNAFFHLVSLTLILQDVRRTFFTVSAVARTTADFQQTLHAAKPLRQRLTNWHQELPPYLQVGQSQGTGDKVMSHGAPGAKGDHCLRSSGSLKLAYVISQLSLFRAMLRPLSMAAMTAETLSEQPSFWNSDGALAVVRGAIRLANELVKLIETLTAADWDGFWHSWSKHNFAIGSTFLMHLLTLCQPPQGSKPPDLSPQPDLGADHAAAPVPVGSASSPQSSAGSAQFDIRTQSYPRTQPNTTQHPLEPEYVELRALTKRWRWALRLAERGAGGRKGLMNASLRRTEALFREWQIGKT